VYKLKTNSQHSLDKASTGNILRLLISFFCWFDSRGLNYFKSDIGFRLNAKTRYCPPEGRSRPIILSLGERIPVIAAKFAVLPKVRGYLRKQ
jgi:hypothetical protein